MFIGLSTLKVFKLNLLDLLYVEWQLTRSHKHPNIIYKGILVSHIHELAHYCLLHVTLPQPHFFFFWIRTSKCHCSINSSWIFLKIELWVLTYVI